jgi:hypothetical protein
MVLPWALERQSDTSVPFEHLCALWEGQQAQARAQQTNTEHEAMQWWSNLTGKQATVMVQPYEPSRHEPTLKAERDLMVDLSATRARAKGHSLRQPGGGGKLRPLWSCP